MTLLAWTWNNGFITFDVNELVNRGAMPVSNNTGSDRSSDILDNLSWNALDPEQCVSEVWKNLYQCSI